MSATTRSRVVELSTHSSFQVVTFYLLALATSAVLYLFVAAPVLDAFFSNFLRSDVLRDGTQVTFTISENRADEVVTTGLLTNWALVDPQVTRQRKQPILSMDGDEVIARPAYHAEYIFKPVIALAPLVLVGGLLIAALITALLPGAGGYLAQKIEREILVALDRLAISQYGEHTAEEIKQLSREIGRADAREIHDLATLYNVPFADLDLLQKALVWKESKGISRFARTHDAIKFYMREYFTDRYSNAILGLVYMGAAVLIIVIGIRGLKFLPSTDPSVVLSALGLEFILLITYAAILMYGRSEESSNIQNAATTAPTAPYQQAIDSETENLLRAFLAIPRSRNIAAGSDDQHSS